MPEISKIKIPDGNTYEFKDAKAHFYGECNSSASSVTKTVSISDFTAADLVAGTTIRVKFVASNTAYFPKLNINSLGEKSICRYGTTAPTNSTKTSWQAGSIVSMTFDGTVWIMNNWLNDDTTYSVFDNLVHMHGSYIADSDIYRYQLLFHVDNDKLTPLNNVSNGYDNTSKAILTNVAFDPFAEIYYYYSTSTIYEDVEIPATYLCFASGSVDLRYSLNISNELNPLTSNKDVYLRVSPQSDGNVKLASVSPLTQTLPSTNSDYWFILLGRAFSAYQIALYPHHEIYTYKGTKLVQVLPQDAIATTSTAGLMSAHDKEKLDMLPEGGTVSIKNLAVTILANTGPSDSIQITDDWITADTACYVHDLATLNVKTIISWAFYDGYVTFNVGATISSDLSFNFGMIKG